MAGIPRRVMPLHIGVSSDILLVGAAIREVRVGRAILEAA